MAEEALNTLLLGLTYPFRIGESLIKLAGLDGSHNYTASDLFDMTSDDDQSTGMGYATGEVPHQAMIQHDSSTSRRILERLETRVSLGADGIEIKIDHPNSQNQVWQLDSLPLIGKKSKPARQSLADMDMGSPLFMYVDFRFLMDVCSPFFMAGISHQDKRNGYFSYDSKGYPVPHDRIFKAEREGPAIPPTKRKTVHAMRIKRGKSEASKRGKSEAPKRSKPEAPESDARASRWYDPWVYQPPSWRLDNKRKDRRRGESKPDFEYTQDAQLVWRKYTTEEIRAYLDECPRKYALWLQRDLSQFNHRLQSRTGKSSVKKDRHCRWRDCPAEGKPVSGMYRVAFDEFPMQTSHGIKDPFKVAMVTHLWCFEQIFDPVIYHQNGRLHLDTRTFATPPSGLPDKRGLEPHPENLGRAEDINPFSIRIGNGKRSNNHERIPEAAYYPWLEKKIKDLAPAMDLPRIHDESLGYAFTLWQLEKETKSKLALRKKRHGKLQPPERDGRPESERFCGNSSTLHLGSLKGWKAFQKPTKKKNKKNANSSTTQCRDADPRDNEESPDEDDAPPQPRGEKRRRPDASEPGGDVDERPQKSPRKDKEP
ncbi:hypothetical protein E4U13_003921 [Claviceps humidiphila]|uniref:Uncharacterized protein n=1 Tax=Claviceps humidiphila TaxID=1294629 RepID=A0A9P7TW82_9HYPO|nr:hypothetical protein E4U13_003921 [Claviceps humidiphila]